MASLSKQFLGYRLTTALITYHLPDYPKLLQEFLWQNIDIPPRFPELKRFLGFWEENIEGRLHSVEIASTRLIHPGQMRFVDHSLKLN